MGIMDKLSEREAWTAEYKGHKIEVVNKGKIKLLIDGEEADRQKGLINSNLTLTGNIPGTDEQAIFVYDGYTDADEHVSMFIGKELSFTRGIVGKDGKFVPSAGEDEENSKDKSPL